jgi:L-serine dehydratase
VSAPISILNTVLGPVMRGPSSSHTAGPYFIGKLARSLLGEEPAAATFTFDPGGSFAEVYRQQGSDLGFAAGVMGWDLADERFPLALQRAADQGLTIAFAVRPLPDANHPNTVEIEMVGQGGRPLSAQAQSTGGGSVLFTRLADRPIGIRGDAYDLLLLLDERAAPAVEARLSANGVVVARRRDKGGEFLHVEARCPWPSDLEETLRSLLGVRDVWMTSPVFLVPRGEPIFASAAGMVALATEGRVSLGQIALRYEAALLGLPAEEVLHEAVRRYRIMAASVNRGLAEPCPQLQLLEPSAAQLFRAEADGQVAVGGLHTRAGARALAVMHVNAGRGLICAAPTAGAAGVLPAVVVTLAEESGLDEERVSLALLAAGAIGVIVANRATFAAEVAGCQVEIGAAGAMAAAAVVDAAGGTPGQAAAAAAISFQNTMGSVCDLVGGLVEIPCHTRNAAAASTAFLCADLVMGGYQNPIPLDETIDAVYAVGRMLPRELRCTALGGLAQTPTALALSKQDGLA